MKTLLTYRKPIVALFAAIVFALTLHGVSHAQTHIHVDTVNGINAPTGRGSAANPYQSITFALLLSTRNNLPDPWHVHIHPGTYDADLAKPANAREIFPLKLRREMIFEGTTTAEECIIDGQHTGDATVPILSGENTEGVTLRNLTIRNSLRTRGVGGIVLHDPTGTNETPSTLEGCIVHNNKGGGVWSNMPLILTGNTFSNNHLNGVATTKSAAATNNTFIANSEYGLYISGNSTGDLSENTFQANGLRGLQVQGTLEGTVTRNAFKNNWEGIEIRRFTGDFTHNTVTENRSNGVQVSNFEGNFTHNTATANNYAGFNLSQFVGNFMHNTATANGHHGRYPGLSAGTFIGNVTHNKFTRNTGGGFNVNTLTGNVTHNLFDSNSGYRGGGFELHTSTNTVEVSNNIFFNNTVGASETGNAVVTRHATHFMNNLFMISDELSEGVSGAHTIWVSSPGCRFHNNIFTNVKTAIYTEGTFDLPITHNLFHNVRVDFVEQAGNNLGNDLLFWELVAVNATNNLEGAPQLVDPVTTRNFHLQATSPAIDAGTNAFAPADDFDEVARPIGNTVDIGPYEYGTPPVVTTQDPIVPDDPPSEPVEDTPPAEPTLKLYWTTGDKIQRADVDGSNIQDLLTDKKGIRGIALDVAGGKMYWCVNWDLNDPDVIPKIQRANLDGTNIQDIVTSVGSPEGIALDVAGGKMYWTDTGNWRDQAPSKIQRANLDGTNIQDIIIGVEYPNGIALDVAGGKMYWTDTGTNKIQRANLDGTNIQDLVTSGEYPNGIALDVAGGKMYWTDTGTNKIQRANLDGTNIQDIVTSVEAPQGIALDVAGGKMYWTDCQGAAFLEGDISFDGQIQRANLDSSHLEDVVTDLRSLCPHGIALGISQTTDSDMPDTTPDAPVAHPAWDVNEDGQTDVTDFALVAAALGQAPPGNPRLDVNGDGTVDLQDLALIAQHLGESTVSAAPAQVVLPASLTPQTVQRALNLLRAQDNGSPAFQRGIALLEQLLASLVPKETALLANYPNPFNPETWIPYQLAAPADVTLTLYAVDGTVVRTLALGHQPAGVYQHRSRAAYWDGRNALGEPVASGVYFYTLTAGDFTATRKMLIRK